jgi:hypothetical protein
MAPSPLQRALSRASAALGALTGPAGAPPEEERGRVNQIQIQESLQRFVGVFMDRMLQAAEPLLADARPKVRTLALHQTLLYGASAIDIATGRFPEINLLDMLVFMDLTSGALRQYWIPEVYGEGGRPLEAAFARSAQDLDRLAGGILTPEQLGGVHRLTQDWRRENPDQRRVEQIRPFIFAASAGRLATERDREARGILVSVRVAIQSADEAVLLAERAMFLVHRMPFLLRFQARLGLLQLIQDGLAALGAEGMLAHAKDLQPLLGDVSTLAATADEAAKDGRALLDSLRPLLALGRDGEELRVERLVASATHLVEETRAELGELGGLERVLSSADRLTGRASALLEGVRAERRRAVLWVALLGAFLVSLFWGGYVVAHRLARADRERPGAGTAISAAERDAG